MQAEFNVYLGGWSLTNPLISRLIFALGK